MQEKLSLFAGDLLHLFTAPSRLAEDIDEKPRLGGTIVFLAIFSITQTIAMRVIMKQVMMGNANPLTPELKVILNFGTIFVAMMMPFSFVLTAAIDAVKLYLIGKIFKGSGKFESIFSMTLYTTFINQIALIINALLVRLSGNIHSSISPAYFLPQDVNTTVRFIVSMLNPFSIGIFIIHVIMLQVIHKFGKKSAIATTALSTLLGILFLIAIFWWSSLVTPYPGINPIPNV